MLKSVQKLKYLERPVTAADIPKLFYTVIEMIPASLSLSVALLGSHLYDGLAFYMCNKNGDTIV